MFTKIAFTIALIFAVWRGFKWWEALQRRLAQQDQDDATRQRSRRAQAKRAKAIDLEACARCGAYKPRGEICPNCDVAKS